MIGHQHFTYKFSMDGGLPGDGINFGEIFTLGNGIDVLIYYSGSRTIPARCSRWDENNYSIIFETILKKGEDELLRNYITPGAVGILFTILDEPQYYDKTFSDDNTIKLTPIDYKKLHFGITVENNNSNLINMRKETTIYVENYGVHPLDDELMNVKIEGKISGSIV